MDQIACSLALNAETVTGLEHSRSRGDGDCRSTRFNRGFTLIELLVAFGILAVIALLAIPLFLKILEQVQLEANNHNIEQISYAIRIYNVDHVDLSPLVGEIDENHELIKEGYLKEPVMAPHIGPDEYYVLSGEPPHLMVNPGYSIYVTSEGAFKSNSGATYLYPNIIKPHE